MGLRGAVDGSSRGAALLLVALAAACGAEPSLPDSVPTGYTGLWFALQPSLPQGYKYSGGLGTFSAKHRPVAIHVAQRARTYFVYSSATGSAPCRMGAMIGFYEHDTGMVSRPRLVHEKTVCDPHDNPALAIDETGHLWVFVSGRARLRPGITYRSMAPHAIDRFERIAEEEYTYPQPWWLPGRGFLFLFTRYRPGRQLYWRTSRDGLSWSRPQLLAGMGGHYQVSARHGQRIGSAFNWHPQLKVDRRTNLYYVQTDDAGASWRTADGKTVATPLREVAGEALVHDYRAEGKLVYLKDLAFDALGQPIVLFIASDSHLPGERWMREWVVAHWNGQTWQRRAVTRALHNYDTGSLIVREDGRWSLLAPTGPGTVRWGTGGEIVLWESADAGDSWQLVREVTRLSRHNQSYLRAPVDAHPSFCGLWGDGDAGQPSRSRLFFTSCDGLEVWRLPTQIDGERAPVSRVHEGAGGAP